jgi:hypothetical protein
MKNHNCYKLQFNCYIQCTPLNRITLGETITDPFNRMIPITEHMSYKRRLLKGCRDLINLSHFDPIIRMITLTVIPLSGAHCSTFLVTCLYCWLIISTSYQAGNMKWSHQAMQCKEKSPGQKFCWATENNKNCEIWQILKIIKY